jgi:phosphoribosyl 1,2-cyclic phosphate phosphodiesterase
MSLSITLLGTGTSAGVPMIGCTCDVCRSDDPRDHRDRAAAMVEYDDQQGSPRAILIDTSTELRHQMIRHDVMRIDGVVYTHNHADHIFGIDDLRRFNAVQGEPLNIYAEPRVIEFFRHMFGYIFEPTRNINKSFVPTLIPHAIEPAETFELFGWSWVPIRLLHGRLPILGFRIGDLAYCTDVSAIPPQSYELLEGLDVLILDALRYRHHPTHLTVDQALQIVQQLQPRRAYFTHIAHDIRHAELEAELPEGVHLAYDGLKLDVQPVL